MSFRRIAAGFLAAFAWAQNPFVVASQHYKLEWENEWARVVRVSYGPREKSPMHDHPALPTVYIYLTEGGVLRFKHFDGPALDRAPVKIGGIRFARPNAEQHEVENLSDSASQYLRVELKNRYEAMHRDARLPPPDDPLSGNVRIDFENSQLAIVRVSCPPHSACPVSAQPERPAIVVSLTDAPGKSEFEPAGKKQTPGENRGDKRMDVVRLELKSGL